MTTTLKRLPSLDGLRAFSILLVCIGHVAGTVGSPDFLLPLHSLGNYGVKIFFVISGFLITYLLLIEQDTFGKINLKQFYIRRCLRLFPAFYFFVGCMAVAHFLGWIELLPGDLFHASTYTMNYHHERAWWLNHTWSLAVEEQFYLLWPLLLMFFGRLNARSVAIVAICCAPFIRAYMWFGLESSPSAMTREFQAVADALATGCLLAYLYKSDVSLPQWLKGLWFYSIPAIMFIIPAIMSIISPPLFYILGQTIVNLCAVLVIWRFLTVQKGFAFKLLNVKPAIWLGGLSYSLYLWQEPFLNSWVRDWYASWPINIALAFGSACLSYYVIEKPALRLRKKFISNTKKRPQN